MESFDRKLEDVAENIVICPPAVECAVDFNFVLENSVMNRMEGIAASLAVSWILLLCFRSIAIMGNGAS